MSRDTDLLFAIGTMRFIPRMWRQFYLKDTANLAEHNNRVVWIALVLATRTAKTRPVDIGRVLQLALMHDMDEIRTGDVQPLTRRYTIRKSDEAVADTIAGTSVEELMASLHQEMKEKMTIEAQLAKDADILDVDLEMLELAFMGHKFGSDFTDIRDKIRKLTTDAARDLLDEILQAKAEDWFRPAYNL